MKTMTGYGFYQLRSAEYELNCQSSLEPSRFLEVSAHVPTSLIHLSSSLEYKMRSIAASCLKRGKLQIGLNIQPLSPSSNLPTLDLKAVDHYTSLIDQLQKQMAKNLTSSFASLSDISPVDLMRLEGVLVKSEWKSTLPRASLEKDVLTAVDESLKSLCSNLEEDAKKSKLEIIENLSSLEAILSKINLKLPDLVRMQEVDSFKAMKDFLKALGPLEAPALSTTRLVEANSGKSSLDQISLEKILRNEISEFLESKFCATCVNSLQVYLKEFIAGFEKAGRAGKGLECLCERIESAVVQLELSWPVHFVSEMLEMKQTIECLREQAQNIE